MPQREYQGHFGFQKETLYFYAQDAGFPSSAEAIAEARHPAASLPRRLARLEVYRANISRPKPIDVTS
jgi:hypothetical protein